MGTWRWAAPAPFGGRGPSATVSRSRSRRMGRLAFSRAAVSLGSTWGCGKRGSGIQEQWPPRCPLSGEWHSQSVPATGDSFWPALVSLIALTLQWTCFAWQTPSIQPPDQDAEIPLSSHIWGQVGDRQSISDASEITELLSVDIPPHNLNVWLPGPWNEHQGCHFSPPPRACLPLHVCCSLSSLVLHPFFSSSDNQLS